MSAANVPPNVVSGATGSAIDFKKWLDKVIPEEQCYVELQYHGQLGIEAIESVFIPRQLLAGVKDILLPYKSKFKVFTEENGR
ncbi:MAG: hypothetical protein LBS80_04075, partial [Tannerella sp.]|nr:hypothetical protein [Tannerella sp.]